MSLLSFDNLVTRFGEVVAYQYLEQIERAACMQPQRLISSPEIRLANALHVQDGKRPPALITAQGRAS